MWVVTMAQRVMPRGGGGGVGPARGGANWVTGIKSYVDRECTETWEVIRGGAEDGREDTGKQ